VKVRAKYVIKSTESYLNPLDSLIKHQLERRNVIDFVFADAVSTHLSPSPNHRSLNARNTDTSKYVLNM
jgi:hypothetical protein